MKKIIKVVAALIINNENQILICQRPKNKKRALLWEFVGGKVEDKETDEEALIRECEEELSIIIQPNEVFSNVVYEYPDIIVDLTLYKSNLINGTPKLIEHNDFKWVSPKELDQYPFCPADIEIIDKIKNRLVN